MRASEQASSVCARGGAGRACCLGQPATVPGVACSASGIVEARRAGSGWRGGKRERCCRIDDYRTTTGARQYVRVVSEREYN